MRWNLLDNDSSKKPSGLAPSAKLEIVESALWEIMRSDDQSEISIEPGWVQKTTRNAPTPFLNGVFRCELDDSQAESKVQQTVSHYQKLGLPFRWKLGPSSRPTHLPALLTQNGMMLKETLFGLLAEPGKIQIQRLSNIQIEPLTLEGLEDWLEVQKTAWKVPPAGLIHLRETTKKSLDKNTPTSQDHNFIHHFIAYENELPVASAGLLFLPKYAFFLGAAVNLSSRNKGIYKSLLAHRLKMSGERGLPAVIHCLEKTSAPICQKLGFEKVCEIYSYELA